MATVAGGGPTPLPGFCRDCLASVGPGAIRCPNCGSPRLIRHPELRQLGIAHLDCDAFYAAIEKRDDPSLADKPLIIGGGKRGVVSTACYIARTYGVRSAMPMFQALKACPDAVVLPPDMEKYVPVGRRGAGPDAGADAAGRAALDRRGLSRPLRDRTPAWRGAGRQPGPPCPADRERDRHHGFDRPLLQQVPRQGRLGSGKAARVLGDRPCRGRRLPRDKPVSLIWGVGKAMQARLAEDGIRTIGALQRMEEKDLVRRYGAMGLRLARLSRAEDDRAVDPPAK